MGIVENGKLKETERFQLKSTGKNHLVLSEGRGPRRQNLEQKIKMNANNELISQYAELEGPGRLPWF